mmetsp:Transcript_18866/g.39530  ORF Transcript_18866/g.39530 Transcript_18866/m.39530 type:complete len:110 (-) Transcript_18866:143-472(-)
MDSLIHFSILVIILVVIALDGLAITTIGSRWRIRTFHGSGSGSGSGAAGDYVDGIGGGVAVGGAGDAGAGFAVRGGGEEEEAAEEGGGGGGASSKWLPASSSGSGAWAT